MESLARSPVRSANMPASSTVSRTSPRAKARVHAYDGVPCGLRCAQRVKKDKCGLVNDVRDLAGSRRASTASTGGRVRPRNSLGKRDYDGRGEWFIDEPFLYTVNGTKYYVHQNHLFSVAAVTDTAGSTRERYSYTGYGDRAVRTAAGAPLAKSQVNNVVGFTGYISVCETGLLFSRYRMYDPRTGSFISRDPLGYVDGASMYSAYFIPNYLDPLGLSFGLDFWNGLANDMLDALENVKHAMKEPVSCSAGDRDSCAELRAKIMRNVLVINNMILDNARHFLGAAVDPDGAVQYGTPDGQTKSRTRKEAYENHQANANRAIDALERCITLLNSSNCVCPVCPPIPRGIVDSLRQSANRPLPAPRPAFPRSANEAWRPRPDQIPGNGIFVVLAGVAVVGACIVLAPEITAVGVGVGVGRAVALAF